MKSTHGQTWGLIAGLLPQLLVLPGVYAACAPGGSFDLSRWNLQLPSGSPGSPDTISSSALQGCSGYSNSKYFFLDGDGSLVMKVPSASSGCVTTPNSKHCRTELRESNPRSWDPTSGVNRLSATLTVVSAGGSTCIGQIHIDDSISTKPVAELYYDDDGVIKMGVAQTRAGGNQILTTIGTVPRGTKFSYEIRYEGGSLSVILNGNQKTLSTYSLDNPRSYFKAGNYVQGSGASEVHFHAINVSHGSTGSPNSPSAADSSCSAQPDNASDNTVTLNLYSQNSCCGTLVEKIKIGNLGVCHNGDASFTSLNMKVGQNLFGKSNHVLLYSGRDCTGTVYEQNLTNAAKCWQGATWQSFMVAPPSKAKRWVS